MTAGNPTLTASSLALIAAGGLVLLAVVIPSPTRMTLWDYAASTPPELGFPDVAPTLSQADLNAIGERPLFNADRKKDPPILPQGSLSGLDAYRLAGVMAVGSVGFAIIERKQTGATAMLKVGDVLDTRTVAAITSDGVTFTGTAGPETLHLPKIYGVSRASLPEDKVRRAAKKQSLGRGDKEQQ